MGYELNEPATEQHSLIYQGPLWLFPFFNQPSVVSQQMTDPQQKCLTLDKSHCH